MTLHPDDFVNIPRRPAEGDTDWNGAIYDLTADPIQVDGPWAGLIHSSGHAVTEPGSIQPPRPSEDHYEWKALLTAHDLAKDRFLMYEIGAGYGRWGVNGILLSRNRMNNHKPAHVVFVEASPHRIAALRSHLKRNNIHADDHVIHQAALATGHCELVLNDTGFGAWTSGQHIAGVPTRVIGEPLTALLDRTEGTVDCIHMDVQGAEFACLNVDAIREAARRVRMIHVATHGHAPGFSREDEYKLETRFLDAGWTVLQKAWADDHIETPWGRLHTCDGWITVMSNLKED